MSKIHTGPGLTEQSHKKETDLNYILKDYQRTGYLRHAKNHQGKYDDITTQDFQEAMFKVTEAKRMFEELPAAVRKRFKNDPAQFLDFVHDEGNLLEMKKLGILKGNDGINVEGTKINVPTQAEYDQYVKEKHEAEAAAKKAGEGDKKT